MNRRTFLKGALGTLVVLWLNPLKVLAEKPQQIPQREVQPQPSPLKVQGKDTKLLDMVRLSYPALLAQQLCSVQPMTQAAGQIFVVKYVPGPWYKRMGNWFKKTPKVKDGCWGGGCCK